MLRVHSCKRLLFLGQPCLRLCMLQFDLSIPWHLWHLLGCGGPSGYATVPQVLGGACMAYVCRPDCSGCLNGQSMGLLLGQYARAFAAMRPPCKSGVSSSRVPCVCVKGLTSVQYIATRVFKML